MREVKIVSSPIEFMSIKELKINRAINDHGKIEMEGYIESNNETSYRQMLMGDVWMEIQAVGENDETRILFNGIVTDFSMHASEHNCVLALTIMTGSYLMDTLPHFRSFQNTSDRYLDVLELINEQYYSSGVIVNGAGQNSIDAFYLQYNETDWAFAKRLASKCGHFITPGIEREGVIYYFGLHNKANYSLPDNVRYKVRKNLKDYRIKKASLTTESAFSAISSATSPKSEDLQEMQGDSVRMLQNDSDNSSMSNFESRLEQLAGSPKREILSENRIDTAIESLNDTGLSMVSNLDIQMAEVEAELVKGSNILMEMHTIAEKGFTNTLPQSRRTVLGTHYADAMSNLKNSQGLVSTIAAKTSDLHAVDGLQAWNTPSELTGGSYTKIARKLRESMDSISKLNGNLNDVITRTCPFEIMVNLERQSSDINSNLEGCNTLLTEMIASLENLPSEQVPDISAPLEKDKTQKSHEAVELHEHDCMTVVFEHREIYDLFDRIYVDGMQMIVSSIESRYIGQELIHTYVLSFEKGLYVPREYNLSHNGVSLPGVVKDVKEDVVQISLYNDENDPQKVLCWFPYSTIYSSPDGTGWYCMPEIGDTVRMHVPERNEDSAYVISAVHMETDIDRKDPDIKSIKTKYGKEVRFTPDSIVITNNAGMAIEISDSKGISIVSDKNISLTAKGSVSVSSDEGSVTVAGDSTVNLKQSGSSLTLDGDINMSGGDLRVH